MPITAIDIGAAPDDGTGDPLRRAFQITNENFADLDTTKADTADVANALALKVDAVAGKGLSTADFTNEEKDKLDGVEENATYNRPDSENALAADVADVVDALALKADTADVVDALALKADKTAVAPAIAMAQTFTAVPTTLQSPVIYVTQPHWRTFIWTGTKYERAPWHMPGKIFPADGPAANVRGAIQMRSDVVYNVADYPDLAAFYGFTGSTFVLKDARARVIRGADLGRNIDTALVNGYLQEDAIRNIDAWLSVAGEYGSDLFSNTTGAFALDDALKTNYSPTTQAVNVAAKRAGVNFSAARVVPTASENRVKSLVATYYVTI